jgi:mRNA interferase MazF
MNRGEVWWISFDPSIGGEIRKTRPAVIVSNNAANRNLNLLQVIPLSSNMKRLYPSEASVSLNGKQNKAMADQLTTASRKRFLNRLGELSKLDMQTVEHAIRVQLDLL